MRRYGVGRTILSLARSDTFGISGITWHIHLALDARRATCAQANMTSARSHGGAGLGLHFVKELISKHKCGASAL